MIKPLRTIARHMTVTGLLLAVRADRLIGGTRKRQSKATTGIVVLISPLGLHDIFGERQGVRCAAAVNETKLVLQIGKIVEERGGVGRVRIGGEPDKHLTK